MRQATLLDPEHFPAWFVRGVSHLELQQNEMAALCFGSCVALNKEHAPAWLNRGLAYSRLRFFEQACDDYDRALRLDPTLVEALLQRATAKEALGDLPGAIADLTAALDKAPPRRASTSSAPTFGSGSGTAPGRPPTGRRGCDSTAGRRDELDRPGRAPARRPEGRPGGRGAGPAAEPDVRVRLAAQSPHPGRATRRDAEAIPVLDRAVELYPDYVPARAGRGVLLARAAGTGPQRSSDAEEALLRDTKGPNLYQVACIYALTSRTEPTDKAKALELLRAALGTRFGLDLVDTDSDLDPIRGGPRVQNRGRRGQGQGERTRQLTRILARAESWESASMVAGGIRGSPLTRGRRPRTARPQSRPWTGRTRPPAGMQASP